MGNKSLPRRFIPRSGHALEADQPDLALIKLAKPNDEFDTAPTTGHIGDCYAHFASALEHKLKEDLTADIHAACLAAACEEYGVHPSDDTQKIPDVVYQVLNRAREQGHESAMKKSSNLPRLRLTSKLPDTQPWLMAAT